MLAHFNAETLRATRARTLTVISVALLVSALLTAPIAGGAEARAAKPKRMSLFPAFRNAVPVLIYHRVESAHGGYSVSPGEFAAQMRRLHELGFEAITLERYVAFMRGKDVSLPQRPILITFDDGYVSAWENADPVLARYGWAAAMYVPTAAVGRGGHLTWTQLRQMQASGRWQVDEHAGSGHVLIRTDAAGRMGPFYANERWANGRRESFAHYRRRAARDIQQGAALLAKNVPDSAHDTFAVPFNNYGQFGTNDRRIAPWLVRYLKANFAVAFVQHDHRLATPGQRFANRIGVGSNCDANQLEVRLRDGLARLKKTAARHTG